jgi:hypothetical protein
MTQTLASARKVWQKIWPDKNVPRINFLSCPKNADQEECTVSKLSNRRSAEFKVGFAAQVWEAMYPETTPSA